MPLGEVRCELVSGAMARMPFSADQAVGCLQDEQFPMDPSSGVRRANLPRLVTVYGSTTRTRGVLEVGAATRFDGPDL